MPTADFTGRTCPTCQAPIVRRDKENAERFSLRVFCDKRCYKKARRTGNFDAVRQAGSWQGGLAAPSRSLCPEGTS